MLFSVCVLIWKKSVCVPIYVFLSVYLSIHTVLFVYRFLLCFCLCIDTFFCLCTDTSFFLFQYRYSHVCAFFSVCESIRAFFFFHVGRWWPTRSLRVNVPSSVNTDLYLSLSLSLSPSLSLKPGGGPYIALHASCTSRISAFLIRVFPVHSSSFFFLFTFYQNKDACGSCLFCVSDELCFALIWPSHLIGC